MNRDSRKQKITSFTDLLVWQKGHAFVVELYKITNSFPATEAYGLTSQIRRASVSITSNIAEGFGRQTYKEKVQFYYMAQGSLVEVKNQLLIAKDVGYLDENDFDSLAKMINEVHALLQGFIKKTKELSKKPKAQSLNLKSSILSLCAIFVTCVISFTSIVYSPESAHAAINAQINYQGKLTNASNIAVANDTFNIEFKLYTQETGGSAIWTETLTGVNQVSVSNGLFSTMLGSTTALDGIDFNQTLYLGVNIGGTSTPSWDGEMTPRKILGAVPAAFYSATSTYATNATNAASADTVGGIASTSLLRSDEDDTASGLLTFTGGFISNSSSTITNLTSLISTSTNAYISTLNSVTAIDATTESTIEAAIDTLSNLTSVGTIGTGVWQASVIDSLYLDTNVLLDTELTNSASLASLLSDETGSSGGGLSVFSNNPLLSGFRSNASSTIGDGTGTGGLTISGNSTTTGGAYFAGNVGIGTASPGQELEVNGSVRANLFSSGSTDFGTIGFGGTTAGSNQEAAIRDGGLIITRGAGVFGWESAANNPYSGTIDTQLSRLSAGVVSVDTGTKGNSLGTLIAGNVGIGTTTPSRKLTVAGGDIWVGGDLTATGTITGADASFTNATTTNLKISGLVDNNSALGQNGMVLQTNGNTAQWVATNTLGFGTGNGTVTSVDMSVPTGFSIAGNPITTAGTLALTLTGGYVIPTTTRLSNLDSFYNTPSNRITDGTGLTWSTNTLNCDEASASQVGCLATADWTSFNNKVSSTSIDTSAELAALVTDETGIGSLVFSGSPTFTGGASFAGINVSASSTLGYASSTALTVSGTSYLNGTIDSALTAGVVTSGSTGILSASTTIGDSYISDALTIGSGGSVDDAALSANVTKLGSAIDLNTSEVTGTLDLSDHVNLTVGNGITLTGDQLTVTGAGGLSQATGGLTTTGVLQDLNTLGANTGNDEFLVSTAAGTLAWESGATARTSLGVDAAGTDNSTNVTLAGTPNYLTLSGQQITLNKLDIIDDLNTFTSANLASMLTDETGTSNVVFSASPTFTGGTSFAGINVSASSTLGYASSTALTVTGNTHLTALSDGCLNVTSGIVGSTGTACGAGGGGGGGTFATTTMGSRVVNAPISDTDIVAFGSTSTTTAEFWFDPSNSTSYLAGRVGIGSTTPQSQRLTIDNTGVTGPAIAGINQYLQFTNSTEGAVQYGDNARIIFAPTATSTLVGDVIRIYDDTTLGNTVRGLEVQAHRGTNTKGENTGINSFGRTFGIKGTTQGDAGDTARPAGVFAQTRGTTQGNALRAYSGSITSEALVSFYQDTSAFTGTALLMDIAETTGSFNSATSKFIDFQNNNVSQFVVMHDGKTGIGSSTPSRALTVIGESYLGATTTIAGNFLPLTDDAYDLGSSTLRFRDLYLGPATLHIGSSATDEATFSYDTGSNIFNIGTDSTTNGDIAFFTDDLYIDKGTGFVGIGTTTPTATLTVEGKGSFESNVNDWQGISMTNHNSGSSAFTELAAYNNNGTAMSAGIGSSGTVADIYANRGYLWSGLGFSEGLSLVAASTSADIRFFTGGEITSNERLRISSSGNVGIGASSPLEKLHVYSANNAYVRLESAINQSSGFQMYEDVSGVPYGFSLFYDGGSTNDFLIQSKSNGSLTTKVTIKRDSGNFGIGGDPGSAKLYVNGNVGIGTTTPSRALTVAGDGFIGGALTATGNFSSLGIDDTATGERLKLTDWDLVLGTSGQGHNIMNAVNDQYMVLSGGSGSGFGADIVLYGGAHATLANDFNFRGTATSQLYYDDSASSWDFQANAITTTGSLTSDFITTSASKLLLKPADSIARIYTDSGGNAMIIGAASGGTTGGSIYLYGGTHATKPDEIELYSGGTQLNYGAIASTFDFKANAITTTGGYTGADFSAVSTFPMLLLHETDGTATHDQSLIVLNADRFEYQTRSSAGGWISTDYYMPRDASGATQHVFRVANANVLNLSSTTADFQANDILTTGDIYSSSDTNSIGISGGNSITSGATLTMWGGTHAPLANDIRLGTGSASQLYYNDSASSWDFQANNIKGTGLIQLGTSDTSRGHVYLYGATTGLAYGGIIDLYNAADYDTTYDWYRISSNNGALAFGTDTSGTLGATFTGGTGWDFQANALFVSGLTNSTASNSLCLNGTTWEVTRQASNSCLPSSIRYKHNVFDSELGLDDLRKLRPVSFEYNEDQNIPGVRLGLIAEEVANIDPRLAVYNASGTPESLDDFALIATTIKALQELDSNLESLTGSTTLMITPQAEAFATKFFNNLFNRITTWLADASNGVGDFFANRVRTKEICVSDNSGETCITKSQLDSLLGATGASSSGGDNPPPTTTPVNGDGTSSTINGAGTTTPIDTGTTTPTTTNPVNGDGASSTSNGTSTSTDTDSTTTPDTTAPVISLNGSNQVELTTDDTYIEEGATAIDDIDGDITSSIMQGGDIPVNSEGIYTITYDVSDSAGNAADTVTRTVTVSAAAPVPVADSTPTSTPPTL